MDGLLERREMTYADVSVVVDGALEESASFYDYAVLDAFIQTIREEAEGDGYRTEVYVLLHDHSPDVEECACSQYVQDHNPEYVFNG